MTHVPKRLRDLAKQLNLHIIAHVPETVYQYDPDDRVLRSDNVSGLVHELAHYLVAEPKERTLPNFGYDHGPDGGLRSHNHFPPGKDDDIREEQASLLGIYIERALGLRCTPKNSWISDRIHTRHWKSDGSVPMHMLTFRDHCWTHGLAKTTATALHAKGLLVRRPDGSFYPAVLPPRRDGRAAQS